MQISGFTSSSRSVSVGCPELLIPDCKHSLPLYPLACARVQLQSQLSLRTRQEPGSALVATSCRRSPDKQVTASSANSPGSPPGELAGLQLRRLSRALLHATGRL